MTRDWLEIDGGRYRYKLSSTWHFPSVNEELEVGKEIVEGQIIARSTKHKKADNNLSCWNSLIDAAVFNDGKDTSLGLKIDAPRRKCISLYGGVLKFTDKNVVIEGVGDRVGKNETYPIYEQEFYLYPEGYVLKPGDQFCTGVPDMYEVINKLTRDVYQEEKSSGKTEVKKDFGFAYYIFFSYITRLIGEHNSEIFEVLFKKICDNGYEFSVDKSNKNNDNFVNRQHYGFAKKGMAVAIKNAKIGQNEKGENRFQIEIKDSILLPLLLGVGARGAMIDA